MWGAGIRKLMRRELVLHMVDSSIRGLLVAAYRDGFILENASLMTPNGDEPMGGRQYIPRERVRYVQEPPVKES